MPGLMLETQNTNPDACRFYKAMGFRIGGYDRFLYAALNETREETAVFWYRFIRSKVVSGSSIADRRRSEVSGGRVLHTNGFFSKALFAGGGKDAATGSFHVTAFRGRDDGVYGAFRKPELEPHCAVFALVAPVWVMRGREGRSGGFWAGIARDSGIYDL